MREVRNSSTSNLFSISGKVQKDLKDDLRSKFWAYFDICEVFKNFVFNLFNLFFFQPPSAWAGGGGE